METGREITGTPAAGGAFWSATHLVARPESVPRARRGRVAWASSGRAQPSLIRTQDGQVSPRERRRQPVGAPTYLISTGRQDRAIRELETSLAAAGWRPIGRNPQVIFIDGRDGQHPSAMGRHGTYRLLLVGPRDDPTPSIESGRVDDVHSIGDARDLRIRLDLAMRALVARQRVASSLADARRQAEVDPLTTLGNRRAMDRGLAAALRCASRGTPGAMLLIDVDHFKLYNDRYGHPAGDTVLRRLGETIASSLRVQTDAAYRYGGEEFLVLLSGLDEVEAAAAGERIRAAVEALAIEHLDNEPGCVTISIGLVALPGGTDLDGTAAKDLADDALYAAKAAGRNRVCVATFDGAVAEALSTWGDGSAAERSAAPAPAISSPVLTTGSWSDRLGLAHGAYTGSSPAREIDIKEGLTMKSREMAQ